MSPTGISAGRRAGFTLLEAVVALAVAGIFLAALARALASAWGTAPRPTESLSAVTLARAVAAGARLGRAGEQGGYRFVRDTGRVEFDERPSGLAPAPLPAQRPPPTAANNSGILRGLTPLAAAASPQGPSEDAVARNPILAGLTPPGQPARRAALPPTRLRRIGVMVTTPTRRRLVWQSLRLDDAGE